MAKVAINGFGRIGRAAFKILLDTPELELVAVNDIAPLDNLAYLLKYDTVYGRYGKSVEVGDGKLVVDGTGYRFFAERDPAQLPWSDLGVDIVFECTGIFTTEEGLQKHLQAGAKFADADFADLRACKLTECAVDAARADATTGEMMGVLKDALGWRAPHEF